MRTTTTSTRRSFIWTAGAAFSAPLATAAAIAPANAVEIDDPLKARLAMLEEVNAIRALNQAFARHINAGAREQLAALFVDPSEARIDQSMVGITADRFGEQDVIEIGANRARATAIIHCIVDVEEVIGPPCPLVEMAREQGGGIVRRTERVVFEHTYVKHEGVWKIQRSTHRRT
jgi:hypothetical protein